MTCARRIWTSLDWPPRVEIAIQWDNRPVSARIAARIFAMLQVDEKDAIPPDEISAFCESLKAKLDQADHGNG
jgi:hypothetical protein